MNSTRESHLSIFLRLVCRKYDIMFIKPALLASHFTIPSSLLWFILNEVAGFWNDTNSLLQLLDGFEIESKMSVRFLNMDTTTLCKWGSQYERSLRMQSYFKIALTAFFFVVTVWCLHWRYALPIFEQLCKSKDNKPVVGALQVVYFLL